MSEAKTKSTKATKKPAESAAPASAPATPPPAPAPKAAAPAKPVKAAPTKSATTIVLSVDDKASAKAAPKPRKAAEPKTKAAPAQSNLPDQSVINKMVAEAAYYLAEKRNFATGFEEEDWLKAKEQIMSQLLAAKKPKS
jgi:hypothetical protein